MHSDVPPHEKIRFRRSDLTSLDSLPSAVGVRSAPLQRSLPRRVARSIVSGLLGLAAVVVVAVCLAYVALAAGVGQERISNAAENAVAALFGTEYDVEIGGIGLALDGPASIALEVRDASVTATSTGAEAMRIESVRFGLKLLPLAGGEIRIGAVELAGARIVLSAVPRNASGISPTMLDVHGRADPDALLQGLFNGASRATSALDRLDVERISLADVTLLKDAASTRGLTVERAELSEAADGTLTVDASLLLADIRSTVAAKFGTRDATAGADETVSLVLDVAPSATGRAYELGRHRFAAARIGLEGSRTGTEEKLTISAGVDELDIDLADNDRLVADVDLAGLVRSGDHKLEVERLSVTSGRSTWRFHGAIGPLPLDGQAVASGGYRFELVSDGSTVAPAGSPEAALLVVARLAGTLSTDGRAIDVSQIGVRSGQGEVTGRASITLQPGRSPGLDLALGVDEIPIGQVKQLWPWFAARGARNWVVSNIFGGRVGEGELRLSVPPGRMGNGVPFGPEEVSGRFTIHGTRFDVAGRIPPVRDGYGSVDFRGTDVDIALQSGTVYMPNGRTVDASGGQLIIRAAHVNPVIGKLELDVSGTADAVMALARYEPINVGRFIDLSPDELEGRVQGVVHADIPLQKNIPADSLDWKVDLTYDGLTLSRAFEGQMVSDADGTITVDPTRAVIDAKAKLNGAPATIRMVEPLGGSAVERERRVALQLDDKARKVLAPGLDLILTGTTEVELDDTNAGERIFKASLGRSTLTIPWVGWTKGPGVPAKVQFALRTDGPRTELADFVLSGETFAARGSISLSKGDVTRVRFPSARLNRNDDFSFDLAAKGRGYAINVRGKSIDIRSVVKLYSRDSADTAVGTSSSVPVSLDLEVGSMTGFHGEVLRNVKLSYAGTGARTDRLDFSAVTGNGVPVTFKDVRDGATRSVTMQTSDAGAVLRFLDIYEHMEGGSMALTLAGAGDGSLRGQVDTRDFWVVNEPRLKSLVSTAPPNDGRSLNQAVRGEIDTTRVQFARGFAEIEKGTGYLKLAQGVLRGPLIGSTFQGTFYDPKGNMDMTGTFMPAYGLNRIFGEIPIVGALLGNGRDRGLIGITFRLAGKSGDPQLQVNPLSVIAPGIFRSVFEFR